MAYTLTDCQEDRDYRYSLLAKTDAEGDASLVVVQCNPSLASGTRNEVLASHATANSTIVLAWGGSLPVPQDLYHQRLLEVRGLLGDQPVHRVGALAYGRYPRHGKTWNADYRSLESLEWSELLPGNSFKPTPLHSSI